MTPGTDPLPGDALEVTGGVADVSAVYARVRALAEDLDDLGDRLRRRAAAAADAAIDGDLVGSAVLSPVTFARAEGALLAAATGPDGALPAALVWEAAADATRAAVAAMAAADDLAGTALDSLAHTLGRGALPLVAGGALLAGSLAVADPDGLDRLAARLERTAVTQPDLVGPTLAAVGGALDLLGGRAPVVLAAAMGLPSAPDLPASVTPLADAYGDAAPPVLRRRADLDADLAADPPRDLEDLFGGLTRVAALAAAPDGHGTLAVDTLTGGDGSRRHVVHLPGTDALGGPPWSEVEHVRDLGGNLRLMAGRDTAYGAGVLAALGEAGVRPDEPVVLVGHSQGGMQALALAADDGTRAAGFDVRHVVTAGSPTAQVPTLPAGVGLLALENRGDVVPHLDGTTGSRDPGGPDRVTVGFDAPATGPEGVVERHRPGHYVTGAAAVDASDHPSLVDQRARLDELGLWDAEVLERRVFRLTP